MEGQQPADTVKFIKGFEILDSRGSPIVEVELGTANGSVFVAMIPSGASTGHYEALELRDGDKSRFGGKGVLKAVANVNDIIAPALVGHSLGHQQQVDDQMVHKLDGTQNE